MNNQLDPIEYNIKQHLCPYSIKLNHINGQLTANRIADEFEPKSVSNYYYRIVSPIKETYRSVFWFNSQNDYNEFKLDYKELILNEEEN